MDRLDCVVVGAGVVGLAVARAMARAGHEVVVLESQEAIGTGVSSRNSEVVHAGIYYPPQLAKARLCVAGRDLLYRFCADYGVPVRQCGKLIVATSPDEMPVLEAIAARAAANGVGDLRALEPAEAAELEPEIGCVGALLSPSSGIIDSHALMLALQGDAEAHGAALAFHCPLVGGMVTGDGIALRTGGAWPAEIMASTVVNAAGLGAQAVARSIVGMPSERVLPLFLAKGNYYALSGRSPVSRLIYPVPQGGGLGVHLTLDLGGQARFGPDVEWIEDTDFDVKPASSETYEAIRRYWPGLSDGALSPSYSGIRPKIEKPGGPDTDFLIQDEEGHGVPGLVNLFGIESPGLTASLAIAEIIEKRLRPSR